ncbi:MAG: phospholipid carrier-dependent glycosyltransferase [Parcubacteria group bacterium]|jgi:4-amino-4-deoxy-L-arabinose transferase-like glycosyltransferase
MRKENGPGTIDWIKKNWEYPALILIVALAIFLRVYKFDSWLHFGMDQTRDAYLVSEAVKEGPSHLPLLGPRAGGTFVRLGPIFYYFQYLSAEIFHSVAPPVFAYPDLLFSILTIPLFFLFLRYFFSKGTALLVASLYAFNFVMIQFSRFAWNPNSVPFWTLLTFFALLKSIDENQKKKKYIWLSAAAIGWAIAGQLHFVVLAAIPAVFFFFLLWTGKWRNYSWKEIVFFASTIIILFLPVILSDIKMQGDNIKQFIWAFEYKPQQHGLFENIKASITSRANYYTVILTTYISPTGKASLLAGIVLSIFGAGYLIHGIRKEENEKRKNFLKLIFVWAGVSFLILIPFAFQIKPRFLFFEIFIPFIFVGMGIEWMMKGEKYRNFVSAAAIILALSVIGLNLEATGAWFNKLKNGGKFNVLGNRLSFIQYPKAVTLADFEEIADYLEKKWKEAPAKLYFYGNLELRNPPLYLLETNNPQIDYEYFSYKTRDFSGRYFSITTDGGNFESLPKHYQPKFDLVYNETFDKLAVQELRLKPDQPKNSEKESLKEPKIESETEKNAKKGIKKSERVLWGELF